MLQAPLKVLVVEDDYFLADRLAEEIRSLGGGVVGPFPDVHDAIHHVDSAQAAILDVRVGDETVFDIAECLMNRGTPFLFYTGYGASAIPPRFAAARVFVKPCSAHLLMDHLQRLSLARPGRDEAEEDEESGVLNDLRARARELMPDEVAADRLVEATLEAAISQGDAIPQDEGLRDWMLDLMQRAYHLRAGSRLH